MENIRVQSIPIDKVRGPIESVRRYYREDRLKDLSNSLKNGVLQPIIVSSVPKGFYDLIIGSRRLRAARMRGMKNIPAVITGTISNQKALLLALTENLQRQDLTPFEEAWGILRLIKDYKLSISEASKELGKNSSFIRKRLKLLSLPKEIQLMVGREQLSMSHIESLASLNSKEEQEKFARLTLKEHLSPAELQSVVRENVKLDKARKTAPEKMSTLRIAIRITAHKKFLRAIHFRIKDLNWEEKEQVLGAIKELKSEIDYILNES